MDDLERKICEIIAKEARIDVATVVPTATIEDLKIASIDLVQIIFAIEEAFDIEIPEDAVGLDVKNVGDVVAAVRRLVEAKGGAAPAPAPAPKAT
jgi:acyl carrier protein